MLLCCWECIFCFFGLVNLCNGFEICIWCLKEIYFNEWKIRCIDLFLVNIKYFSIGGVVIFVFVGGGIVIILLFFIVFCRCWNFLIVKVFNRELSFVFLIGIFLFFGMVISNFFEFIYIICKIIYLLCYFIYNMCFFVLLVKILCILSVFEIFVVLW